MGKDKTKFKNQHFCSKYIMVVCSFTIASFLTAGFLKLADFSTVIMAVMGVIAAIQGGNVVMKKKKGDQATEMEVK